MVSHKNNHNHKLSKFCAMKTQQKVIENRFDLNKITLFQKIKLIYRNYPIKNSQYLSSAITITPNIFFPSIITKINFYTHTSQQQPSIPPIEVR